MNITQIVPPRAEDWELHAHLTAELRPLVAGIVNKQCGIRVLRAIVLMVRMHGHPDLILGNTEPRWHPMGRRKLAEHHPEVFPTTNMAQTIIAKLESIGFLEADPATRNVKVRHDDGLMTNAPVMWRFTQSIRRILAAFYNAITSSSSKSSKENSDTLYYKKYKGIFSSDDLPSVRPLPGAESSERVQRVVDDLKREFDTTVDRAEQARAAAAAKQNAAAQKLNMLANKFLAATGVPGGFSMRSFNQRAEVKRDVVPPPITLTAEMIGRVSDAATVHVIKSEPLSRRLQKRQVE